MRGIGTILLVFLGILFGARGPSHASVATTNHNLSAEGPGPLRAEETSQICVFCHTPHNASPAVPLWNREIPPVTYILYESSTLEATLNQPTGTSRLCLSCHDGTIALGAVRRLPTGVTGISLGPIQGQANLGVDLSDDHPVSFIYDSGLAVKNPELVPPPNLAEGVELDETQQLQCTTCHDPHEDGFGKFLVMEDRFGQLCTACHQERYWGGSSHATSGATWSGAGSNPWPHTPYTTVAENACENCHRPHAAGLPPRLLNYSKEEDNCFSCHNGSVATKRIEAAFSKFNSHPVRDTERAHDPDENPPTMPRHVECQDCHNGHAVDSSGALPPSVSGRLRGVSGVSASGGVVGEAAYEYEVCFKCHGLTDRSAPLVTRADNVSNVRLEFDSVNPSFHPVEAVGQNPAVPSLKAPLTSSSLIYCSDCHSSDNTTAEGRGPHGSQFWPILEREYQLVGTKISESASVYALCYKCHSRTSILNDQSGFPHREHVVGHRMHAPGEGASCAVCHDSHGSRTGPHLINFMTRDRTGAQVVTATDAGQLEFQDLGQFRGRCFLVCHGEVHDPLEYPD